MSSSTPFTERADITRTSSLEDAVKSSGDAEPRGYYEGDHPVSVEKGEAEFNHLQRHLTHLTTSGDPEKAGGEDEFDLRAYLNNAVHEHHEAGIKPKHVGVTWDDLTVEVPTSGKDKFYLPHLGHEMLESFTCLFETPAALLKKYLRLPIGKPPATRPILHHFNGVLRPGEMCLVLGVPNSGCTTFLKVMANQRGLFGRVDGTVEYAGISHEEMSKKYSGEVVYNQEDDIHIPTLTVGQTIAFALSTKTPGKRIPGISGSSFNEELLNTLLKMVNITHTKDTMVGNEFVRGVSGGERKRVSIIEMMATNAHVVSYDNSTRGLDASTALDFAKCLRITTDLLGQTTFVSLYQAGEGIYNLFDKVMVIDKGRCVYYGPTETARSYFVNLGFEDRPRQSTADFLTGCTDPNERAIAEGRDPSKVPQSPEALEAAYRDSEIYDSVVKDREDYKAELRSGNNHDQDEFRQAVLESKKKGASKKGPYTLGFWGQVGALTRRQFTLQLQDKFTICTTFAMSLVAALFIGGVYINLPSTTFGGFTKGGVMFLAILVNTLDAFAEMPLQMAGKPIIMKQTAYKFYRPGALPIANTLADLPFSAVRLLLFDIIVYFMANLHRSVGAFLTFHIFVYLVFLALQGMFRTLGMLSPNFDVAFRLAALSFPNLINFTGYLISLDSMQDFMKWIYYINPMAYGFSGIMENEFGKIDMTCDPNQIVPRNPPGLSIYPEDLGPNQVCASFGARPGLNVVHGEDYIDVGYSLKTSELWSMNFVVLIVFFWFFQFTQVYVMERVRLAPRVGGSVYVKEDADAKTRNERLKQRKIEGGKSGDNGESFETSGKSLIWKDVNYTVPVTGGTRRLLHNVTGYVKPGTLTALMGSSGAGKTTCLDVLAQRKNIGVIEGTVLLDGKPLTASFGRETAYAEQMDVHEGTATVREAMRFSAYLRQPYSVTKEEKDDYVESIIELLELQDMCEAVVQTLGVEARKRLTIGVELASRPSALLFLDEPTSGLDAQSAFNLVRFLRKLSAAGQAILCTIHQPSALLFEQFDRLLLLERGGETVYFGDIGKDSAAIRAYFASNGAHCPPDANPAEFMLEAIGAGSGRRIGPRDWNEVWLDSPEFARVKQEIEEIIAEGQARPVDANHKPTKYATPIWYQLQIVVRRANLALWRNPEYIWTRMLVHILISLFGSLTYLQLGQTLRDLQYRVFAIFLVCVLPALVVNQIEPSFIHNRMIFIREASSRMYSPVVFAIGQLLGEIPYSLICAILYWVLMYYPIDFGNGSGGKSQAGYFLVMIIFVEFFGVSLAQAIAALSPAPKIALLANPPVMLVLATLAGVTIPYPNIKPFWRDWLYQLNPFTRVVSGLVTTEMQGLEITCVEDEFVVFEPPTGQTCESWAAPFVSVFGGYLANPNATTWCEYCQYKVGDEFYAPLNMKHDARWRDVGLVFGYFIFNAFVTIVASYYLRYAKR